MSWKQVLAAKRVALWGYELNILQLILHLGFNPGEALEEPISHGPKASLAAELRHLNQKVVHIVKPVSNQLSAENLLGTSEWLEVPLARVARLLGKDSPYQFWLPEDGGPLEVGLLAVGEKATQPKVGLELINELLSTEHALEVYQRLDVGVVHGSLDNSRAVAEMQKARALREFELDRLQFPDLGLENLPAFQKAFDEDLAPHF
ncbi:unnamed protein product [Sphagnum balticum]